MPPIRVAPLRDTPGMNASICAQPIKNASLYEILTSSVGESLGFKKSSMTPPRISIRAIIQVYSKIVEIYEWISKPTMAVGIKPRITFGISDRFFNTVFQKNTIAASMAPLCIAIVKTVKKSDEGSPSTFPEIRICAVEEIGANSVRPSTTPRIIAVKNVIAI